MSVLRVSQRDQKAGAARRGWAGRKGGHLSLAAK